ncbi:MAG: Lrp/AsnC family transcriptional regulator [Candidatus Pacearchaeota archaeon]|jgi:DNA-binding Lrp family transcriptional regulator
MNSNELDVKDRKILITLDSSARRPISFIAKQAGLSKQLTIYRIKKLEKRGIIKGYYPIIDHTKLGFKLYRVGIKLENMTKLKEKEILEYIKKRANWIVTVFGIWDLWFTLYVKNDKEFVEFWNEFYDKYGFYLDKKEVTLLTRLSIFEHSFIYSDNCKRNFIEVPLGPINIISLDDIDKKILFELTNNARQTSLEISNKLKVSERIVRYRIKKLEENKIILKYRVFLDMSSLGYNNYKIFIQLKNINEKDLEKINCYVHNHKNVMFISEALGGFDLDFEIQVKGSLELLRFIDELKIKFHYVIKRIESMEYILEHKLTYYTNSKSLNSFLKNKLFFFINFISNIF